LLAEHDRQLQVYLSSELVEDDSKISSLESEEPYMNLSFEQVPQDWIQHSLQTSLKQCKGLIRYFEEMKKSNEYYVNHIKKSNSLFEVLFNAK